MLQIEKVRKIINKEDYKKEETIRGIRMLINPTGVSSSLTRRRSSGHSDYNIMPKKNEKQPNNLKALWHSTEHVLTQAMLKLYLELKMAMGPATNEGFYFDFEYKTVIGEKDFPKIEKEMQKIIDRNLPFKREELEVLKARKLFKDNIYKQEWLDEIQKRNEKTVVYWTGKEFVDLCAGPHIKSTGEIKAFKLLSVAGAYWRGNEKNKMLARIYGISFSTQKQLKDYLTQIEEAEKRDHRILGKKLELFMIDEEFGLGLPLWLPKGAILRKLVMDFALDTYLKRGYQLVATPHIANLNLWKRSGHWNFYRENMYSPIKVDKDYFMIKPMNCPGHVKIYNSKIRSYKDLPIRFTEMGTVYRYERSGTLHGLTRVRGFTQDDAHIFCAPEQLHAELLGMIDLTKYIFNSFGFKKFEISLSVRDIKKKKEYLGSDKIWELAERALESALKAKKLPYKLYPGEAVFYGPKIDFLVSDAIGRKWQLTTIQVDFNFPEKFDMTYVDKKGKKQKPVMIHRALLGSIERFIGVLLEHYKGAFPVWLAPEQIWIIPVGALHKEYAREIGKMFQNLGFKLQVKDENETISKKIRNGELQKIPYLLVVGDKEMKSKSVRVRSKNKDLGMMKLAKFLERVKKEVESKK